MATGTPWTGGGTFAGLKGFSDFSACSGCFAVEDEEDGWSIATTRMQATTRPDSAAI